MTTKCKESPAQSSELGLNKTVPVTDAQIGDCVTLIDLLSIGGRFYGKLENGRQPTCRVREMVFEVIEDPEGELYRRCE